MFLEVFLAITSTCFSLFLPVSSGNYLNETKNETKEVIKLSIQFCILFFSIFKVSPLLASRNLSCFACSTIEDPNCRIVNMSHFDDDENIRFGPYATRKCTSEEVYCSVMRLDYILPKEQGKRGEMRPKAFWAVNRNCAKNCYQGCLILGKNPHAHTSSNCYHSFFYCLIFF